MKSMRGLLRRLSLKRLVLIAAVIAIFWLVSAQLSTMSPAWKRVRRTIGVSVLAGAITGIIETLIMYPIENVKTQQQLSGGKLIDVWRRTIDHYGYLGLYRGMTPVLIGAIPTQAVRWGSFEFFCHAWGCGSSIQHVFIAGLVSGCFVAVLTGVPIETFKTHMIHTLFPTPVSSPLMGVTPSGFRGQSPAHSRSQSSSQQQPPLLSPTLGTPFSPSSYAPHGTSLFSLKLKGWMPTIIKKIANQSIRFPVHAAYFGMLCHFYGHPTEVDETTATATVTAAAAAATLLECTPAHFPIYSFLAGGGAGLTSILLTQPIDVVKTRMQGITGERYGNCLQCFRTLAQEEGLIVFAHGIGARSLRVSLGAGLTFMLFPLLKQFIGGDGHHHGISPAVALSSTTLAPAIAPHH